MMANHTYNTSTVFHQASNETVVDGEATNTLHTMKKIIYSLIIGISVIGLIGNALCVKVMGKVQLSAGGVRLIRYLTVADILVLVLWCIPPSFADLYPNGWVIIGCFEFLLVPISKTVHRFEIYLTVLIALQRCLALAIPLRFKAVVRDSTMNKVVYGILVFCIAYHIPYYIAYKPIFKWNSHFNMTLITATPYSDFPFGFRKIYNIITTICFHDIPVILLVACNIVLIVSRRRMSRIGGSKDRTGANQLTAIVLAITAISIIVHCLHIIAYMGHVYKLFESTTYSKLRYIRDLMTCVNSSTNFIFYCTFGRQFRQILMGMFKRGRVPQQNPQTDNSYLREEPSQHPQHDNIELREVQSQHPQHDNIELREVQSQHPQHDNIELREVQSQHPQLDNIELHEVQSQHPQHGHA